MAQPPRLGRHILATEPTSEGLRVVVARAWTDSDLLVLIEEARLPGNKTPQGLLADALVEIKKQAFAKSAD